MTMEMPMTPYLTKRLALFVPTLLIMSFVVFSVIRLIPGDPAQSLLADGARGAAPGTSYEALRERLGLNQPFLPAYWSWISGLAHGDLGRSLRTGDPVVRQISQRLP